MTLPDALVTTFWSDDAHGVQAPLTEEMLREAEHVLGVALPATLLQLLRVQNGGTVASGRTAFPTDRPNSWSADHVPFTQLMGIGHDEQTLSLLDTPYLVDEWGLPSPVVLLSGDGHYWIALDYRVCGGQGEPSVTWLDADREDELPLAPDFRSFVSGLVSDSVFEDGVFEDGVFENSAVENSAVENSAVGAGADDGKA